MVQDVHLKMAVNLAVNPDGTVVESMKNSGVRGSCILLHNFREKLKPSNMWQCWSPFEKTLPDHYMKLWKWSLVPVKITRCWRCQNWKTSAIESWIQGIEPAQKRDVCYILHQSYRTETSNPFQTKALDTGRRDIGASSIPVGFYFCFDLIFLYYVPFIPSGVF